MKCQRSINACFPYFEKSSAHFYFVIEFNFPVREYLECKKMINFCVVFGCFEHFNNRHN